MCVKLSPRYLNPDPYPPHSTSIYTYKVTTVPKVRGGHQYGFVICQVKHSLFRLPTQQKLHLCQNISLLNLFID